MSSIKSLGLEIGATSPEKADGYVSYVEIGEDGKVQIKKKHLFIVRNDGSFLKVDSNKEINRELFKNEAICLFMRFEDSEFVKSGNIFAVRFFHRQQKNIPALTITRFTHDDKFDFAVESSLLHYKRPTENNVNNKSKPTNQKPINQPPANQEQIVATPAATATMEQLTQLVEKHNHQ